jgi:hypothetical protein
MWRLIHLGGEIWYLCDERHPVNDWQSLPGRWCNNVLNADSTDNNTSKKPGIAEKQDSKWIMMSSLFLA